MIDYARTFEVLGGDAAGLLRVDAVVVAGRRGKVPGPRRVPVDGELAKLEVGDGEADDGSLVQLRRDGTGQRQHLGQLVELPVLLPAPVPRRVPALLLPQLEDAATTPTNTVIRTDGMRS